MSKGTFDSVTLSVCAGCCKTELHAPINNLVVCLDINKKSLASGLVNSKMHNKKNVVICNFNMKNMNQLLAQIHSVSINKGVTFKTNVLFQHPSPSVNGDFKDACISCFSAIANSIVCEIVYVFDYTDNGICFSRDILLACIPSNVEGQTIVSPQTDISCETDISKVFHPTFKIILPRVGWAMLKSRKFTSKEMAVTVVYKK